MQSLSRAQSAQIDRLKHAALAPWSKKTLSMATLASKILMEELLVLFATKFLIETEKTFGKAQEEKLSTRR